MRIELTLDSPPRLRVSCAPALKPSSSFSYRPEIDGLRAIAVLSAVFYHTNLGLPGGFVGVDVFFELRKTLRQTMADSPLGNGKKFVPHLENALRDLWRQFCHERAPKQDTPATKVETLVAKTAAPVAQIETSPTLKIETISTPLVQTKSTTGNVVELFRPEPKASPQPAFLSIITTCRGRLEHLKQRLPTFVAQPDAEVIVVDYDCPEKAGDWVEAHFPQVKVVREKNRPRFELSRARNAGASVASAPWLCFIDADVCSMPNFTARLRDLLKPGHYYQASPRTIETWGTAISARADFERLGGYDEVLQGWGKDDDDYYARLDLEGMAHATFPGDLIRALQHDDNARVENYELKDRWVNESINHVYCQAKLDWMLLRRAPLELETRKELYASVYAAVLRARQDGGPLELKIPIMTRETRACGPMEVRLSYTLPNPRWTGMPAQNAASLRKR